jgi:hypothetical protein
MDGLFIGLIAVGQFFSDMKRSVKWTGELVQIGAGAGAGGSLLFFTGQSECRSSRPGKPVPQSVTALACGFSLLVESAVQRLTGIG